MCKPLNASHLWADVTKRFTGLDASEAGQAGDVWRAKLAAEAERQALLATPVPQLPDGWADDIDLLFDALERFDGHLVELLAFLPAEDDEIYDGID